MARTRPLPEKFLHDVWAQQLFTTGRLESHEGHPVIVLNPGTPNPDTGPDFINAKIQIGGTVYAGDVEIHRSIDEWTRHLHHTDRRYNRVVLHVVMKSKNLRAGTATESGRAVPTLILDRFLIEPVRALWRKPAGRNSRREPERIPCYDVNHTVPEAVKYNWIAILGRRRIELKVRAMQNRLYELASPDNYDLREPVIPYGERESPDGNAPPPPRRFPSPEDLRKKDAWEQLLYESIAEALGYSKNQIPFRRLASIVPLARLRDIDPPDREAYLFMMAGFLDDRNGGAYVRTLRERIRAARIRLLQKPLEQTEWQFFRLRPNNFPTLRIAGLATIADRMIGEAPLERFVSIMKNPALSPRNRLRELRSYVTVPARGYWRKHYTFGRRAQRPLTHLVGKNRADELAINAIIPFLYLYGRTFRDVGIRLGTEAVFDAMPAPPPNAVTRRIEPDLRIGRRAEKPALLYQGKIHLYKLYCREHRCGECTIGKSSDNPI
jgi:hypothetical protein